MSRWESKWGDREPSRLLDPEDAKRIVRANRWESVRIIVFAILSLIGFVATWNLLLDSIARAVKEGPCK